MNYARLSLMFIAAAVLTTSVTQSALSAVFVGKCVRVLDGDTIEVMHGRAPERIRLNGIDCPEKSQAFGKRAKEFTSKLAFGKTVKVVSDKKDRYGRTVGDVVLANGAILNRQLVQSGYAWWYKTYSKDKKLGLAEQSARSLHLGLWADTNPIPPWQFRSTVRNASTVTLAKSSSTKRN